MTSLFATLFPTVGSRFRALLGHVEPEPQPDAGEIARRHTRKLVAALTAEPGEHFEAQVDGAGEVYHADIKPCGEDLIALRVKAAIDEDRAGRGLS